MCGVALFGGGRKHALPAAPGVTLTLAAWLLGLSVTALSRWSLFARYGPDSPSLRLVLDTVDACIALLVVYLVHRRFVRRRFWQDRLLAQGLLLLAVGALALGYVAEQVPGVREGAFDTWLPLTVRTAGAVCILVAALADGRPARRLADRRHGWVLPLAVVAVASATLWAAGTRLPVAFGADGVPTSGAQPLLTAHPALLVTEACAALCFLVASVVLARQSSGRADELLRWLGPAFALAAFAQVNYLLVPTIPADALSPGGLLRTGCYLLLLVGAGRELRQYWDAQSRVAVVEDRRRLARELHDGVIQELAYIRAESYALPADLAAGDRIIAACDRGLDEARAAVQALGRPSDEPLGSVLHRAARELADRYQVDLEVETDDTIDVQPEQQHALMRITREAVSNAVRHGKAGRVHVQLTRSEGVRRLVIQDNGQGFDVQRAVADNAGYGLLSMRDRAWALPGTFDVDAEQGLGSLVTVTW